MILSSADILRILGGNEVVRLSAKIKIVESKPVVSGQEGLFIYIKRYPDLDEFEAVFTLWIESDGSEPDDIVIAEIKTLLPRVEVQSGLMATITTTEFRTEKTQAAPQKVEAPKADLSGLEARFEALAEDIQDRMLLVSSGKPGKPGKDGKKGKDGRDGRDGRDGKDLVATDANLEDLKNVEPGIAYERGQVLTWDGANWTNLFVPQVLSSIRGSAGGGGTANPVENCDIHDGGDFDTGSAYAPTCGGLTTTLVNVATYQILATDFYIGVNYDGLVTLTMPADVNEGLKYVIKDESGKAGQPANYITINGSGGDLVDGEAAVVLGYNYGSLTLIWRDGAWRIV